MAKIYGWKHQGASLGGTNSYTRRGPRGIQHVRTETIRGIRYRAIYEKGRRVGLEKINVHFYGSPGLRKKVGRNYYRR